MSTSADATRSAAPDRAPALPQHGRSPGSAARRAGHVLGALVNVALLLAVTVLPGWDVVPFLTPAFDQVVGLLVVSLAVSAAAELTYAVIDRPAVKAIGDLVTLALSLLVTVRLLQVFPFAFGDSAVPWATIARVLLVLAVVGTVVGMVAALVTLVRAGSSRP
ncbi:MAG: hypothetical protein H5T83_13370 [Actinotalea sp.]|nr:hypothetical protein [Actinotalea sp.]